MKKNEPLSKTSHEIAHTEPIDRQAELQNLLENALQDPSLKEALQAFEMGEEEYVRAMTSSTVIRLYEGNTSNPNGTTDADLDPNQG